MRLGELETAYATQLTHKGQKGEWVVYNEDRKELHRFPATWDEKTVMKVIHFGRAFEMKAFNRGVQFQKDKNPKKIKDLESIVKRNESDRVGMVNRNEMLANEIDNLNKQLDRLTIKN